MEIKIYEQRDGVKPFSDWFKKLDKAAAIQVSVALARLEQGNTSRIKWNGSIGWLRINWGPGIRVYLGKEGNQIIVVVTVVQRRSNKPILKRQKNCCRSIEQEKKAKEV